MAKESEGNQNPVNKPKDARDESRRNLLKVGLGISAVLVVGGVASITRSLVNPGIPETIPTTQTTNTTSTGMVEFPPAATPNFPVLLVANLSDLQVGVPVNFNYPLQETPNILVKLGVQAEGGVGPDSDIVAFSQVCQHLGCIYGFVDTGSSPSCDNSYKAAGPVGYCCCHGSIYDLENGAKVIGGPAPRPVPQVILHFDTNTGNIFATGMTVPTIFGYDTGSNDVSADLQGGTLVS
ncbi:MAG: Rieske 2Fe-2S domain-containing protein [Nitrososphaerales archaeon]